MDLQTEFEFTLPRGYLDLAGNLHRQGVMRLARAVDEIEAVDNEWVQQNEAYLPLVLLSRVVVQIGDLSPVTPQMIGDLFATDLLFLEDLYQQLNSTASTVVEAICPNCSMRLQFQTPFVEVQGSL